MKKIAIPVNESNQIEDHFGQCNFYGVFTVSDNNEVQKIESIESEKGCGCKSNIASVLAENGVSVMLAGGIGTGAINVLNNNNIEVIKGCSGNIEDIVNKYLKGEIIDSGESCSGHGHQHGQEHSCSH